jgi:hypothetical protein
MNEIDIKENDIQQLDEKLLGILLKDHSSDKNIIWATDNYASKGEGYQEHDEIQEKNITGKNGKVIRPRVNKSKAEQENRSREKAEVFTEAWICNKQNNLIDVAWFGGYNPFNDETDGGWTTKTDKITFPDGKSWQDYVQDTRLEMTCGEAPYLISRYNVISGEEIEAKDRIGLLDRKMRVVCENVTEEKEWFEWAVIAYQNIYGFEWQGDNLLLAREAMIFSFLDYYQMQFAKMPSKTQIRKIAEIVSWNLWQMDGIKGVIPESCHDEIVTGDPVLFGEPQTTIIPCKGCQNDDITNHNGIYCKIKDWKKGKTLKFIDLLKA